MVYRGKVRGGVILLPSDARLAEGTEVLVVSKEEVVEENEQEKTPSIWSCAQRIGTRGRIGFVRSSRRSGAEPRS